MHWELSEEQELFVASLREWLQERAGSSVVRGWLDAGDPAGFERLFVERGLGRGRLRRRTSAARAAACSNSRSPRASWGARRCRRRAGCSRRSSCRRSPTRRSWCAPQSESGEVTALAVRADRIPAATIGAELRRSSARTDTVRARRSCGPGDCWCPSTTATRRRCGWWTARPGVSGFTPGRCWIARGMSPISPSTTSRHADSISMRSAALGEIATRAAVLVAADALGASERMLQLAVDYSKQRQQFGRPIGSFQAVKHAAAQMLVTVESSMSIAFYAAQSAEEGLARARDPRGRGEGAGDRSRRRTRRQRADPARRHRLHLGARSAPVLQAGQARPRAVRHAGSVERAHRRCPAAACPSRPDTGHDDRGNAGFHFGLSISMIQA